MIKRIGLACFIVLTSSQIIRAQNESLQPPLWLGEVPCIADQKPRSALAFDHSQQQIVFCFDFEPSQLYPDANGAARDVDLTITSYTPRSVGNISALTASVESDADHPGVSVEKLNQEEPPQLNQATQLSKKVYPFRIRITTAKSVQYYLRLTGVRNGSFETIFKLPMGASARNWLDVEDDQQIVSCWTGSDCSAATLSVNNKIPYGVTVTGVTVTSDPGDLLQETASNFQQQKIGANEPGTVKFTVKAKSISLARIFSGFGKAPQLTATLNLVDEAGRRGFSKPRKLNLEMRPNLLVLFITIVLGVAIGTVIRIDLGRLEKAGLISRKQRFVFAGTTVATGLLVSMIALFTNLKMVVFNDQNTYSTWDPRMLFLTGLVGTIGGIPILYGLLKLPKPGVGPADDKTPPSGGHSQ
jgi:hypothetical protein